MSETPIFLALITQSRPKWMRRSLMKICGYAARVHIRTERTACATHTTQLKSEKQ